MKITKEFRIHDALATIFTNVPFKIVLENNISGCDGDSFLILDTKTCRRYNIPMSLDLVGRMLICSFESRELPVQIGGYVDIDTLENDEMRIESVKKSEVTVPTLGTIPPSKQSKISRTLGLSSFCNGNTIHPNRLPCPFYRITLELSDEEYEECKTLPTTVVVKASFRLA